MKRRNSNILMILLSLSVIMFQSCYNDLDLEEYRPEPTMVMNVVVSSDTVVMATLSRTRFFTDIRNESRYIEDAVIELYANGELKDYMEWTPDSALQNGGCYKSSYRPRTNDEIKIATRYGDHYVWAEDSMIEKIKVKSIGLDCRLSDYPTGTGYITHDTGIVEKVDLYDEIYTYHIKFKDPPEQKNYYCIRIENITGYSIGERLDFSADPIFIAQQDIFNSLSSVGEINGAGGRVFSDEMIDGAEYTLKINETISGMLRKNENKQAARKVMLYSISEAYYKYLLETLNKPADDNLSEKLEEIGFAEPTKYFSNINGGVGIMGVVECDVVECDLADAEQLQ